MGFGFTVVSDRNRKAGSLHLQINIRKLYEGDVEDAVTDPHFKNLQTQQSPQHLC